MLYQESEEAYYPACLSVIPSQSEHLVRYLDCSDACCQNFLQTGQYMQTRYLETFGPLALFVANRFPYLINYLRDLHFLISVEHYLVLFLSS